MLHCILQKRVALMEKEAALLREMTAAAEREQNAKSSASDSEREAVDSRSVYVGNVSRCHVLVLAPGALTGRP